jgi:hypothetical protein
MENRIVFSRHDLERSRPLLSAHALARASDRQLLLDAEGEIDRAVLARDRL